MSGKRRPLSHNRAKSARPMLARQLNKVKTEVKQLEDEANRLEIIYQ